MLPDGCFKQAGRREPLERHCEYKANGNNFDAESRINEFFVQRSFEQHSIRSYRQTVVWGETVGNSVLDVITFEFRDFTIIDIEDARLNQWMVVWDYFGEESNWSSFINLYPEFNPAGTGPFSSSQHTI